MAKIQITPNIALDEGELEEHFVLASGPGGQNVQKVATAVQLRFDIAHNTSLSDEVRKRLLTLAGRRATREGILVLEGSRFRSQARNRADVRERLFDLIRRAAALPKPRKTTRPGKSVKEARLRRKKARSTIKRLRSKPIDE